LRQEQDLARRHRTLFEARAIFIRLGRQNQNRARFFPSGEIVEIRLLKERIMQVLAFFVAE
jgi:hypothetical protein